MSVSVSVQEWGGGITHNHSLAFSGLSGKTNYFVTGQFRGTPKKFNIAGEQYFNASAGIESGVGNALAFSAEVIFGRGKSSARSSAANLGYSSWGTAFRGITDCDNVSGWESDYVDAREETRLAANASLAINFTTWLSWVTKLGVDYQNLNRLFWYGNGTSFGVSNNGIVSVLSNNLFRDNLSTELKFGRYLNDHRIDAFIRGEQLYYNREFNTMPGADFISHILREKSISLSGYSEGLTHHYNSGLKQYAASAGVSYKYKKIAGADIFLKAQFTPEYLSSPDFYPSGNAFFDIRELAFPSSGTVSKLRIEGGFGITGIENVSLLKQDDVIPSEILQFFKGFTNIKTKEWNASVKTGFLNDRITATLTWYDRSTDDNYTLFCFGSNQPNHFKVGGAYLWNYDERRIERQYSSVILNRGLEVDLSAVPVKTGNVKLTLGLNMAYNVNRMTSVSLEDTEGSTILPSRNIFANACVTGYPAGAIYGFDENTGYETVIGNPTPKYHGGFEALLKVKGFTFNLLLDGAGCFDVLNLNSLVADQADGVMDRTFKISSKYVEDGSFLRIRRVGLSYDIPLKSKVVKLLAINLSGGNLLTLSKYSGFSPDVNSFGTSPMSASLDYGSFPVVRTITFGVSAKF